MVKWVMAHNKPLPDNVKLIGKTKTKSGAERNLFSVTCLFCGKARNITRHDHATRLAYHRCKTCSNKNNHPQGEYRGIRISWLGKYKKSAYIRSLDWDISIDYIADLIELQKNKCLLSGIAITTAGDFKDITASIDRIDNSIGYTESNIQLVHKKINMMRGVLTVEEFKSFCEAVAKTV